MTTTSGGAGPARHPEVSEIADFTEGLLPAGRAAEIRSHLDVCDACAGTRHALAEIRTLLGDLGELPAPEPMPADVAARIDAALASEAAAPAAAVDVSRETETDGSRETSLRTASGKDHTATTRPLGHARAAAGPGRGSPRRRRAVIGAALTAAAIGLGTFMLPSGDEPSGSTASDRRERETVGTFSGDPVPDRVGALLDRPTTQSSKSTKHVPNAPMSAPAVSLPPCVAQSIPDSEQALAADEGRYRDSPAYLVVLPHPTDDARVSVFVVATSCEEAEPPEKGDVLLRTSYSLN
ncbi:anti-sigma factor family protein [Streptomyces sp. NPDC060194]|uniref:anti-sigma factor family protein n=1 Tax=Streptomyces sp. NPDC060194 TaxID=3347069 RepID=UPI0036537822